MFKKRGPGILIAAAFIGPGTVTTCLRSGIYDGYSLLWALFLSVIATIILQEMAGRLGIITGKGLPELIRKHISQPLWRNLFLGIILTAIVIGNGAYEAGNLAGASLGLEALFGNGLAKWLPWLSGCFAILVLWKGSYKLLESIFTLLVVLMSLSFAITVFLVDPDWDLIVSGLLVPKIASDSIFNIMALIGTTVVPYNLFLYSALVTQTWNTPNDLKSMRRDIIFSVVIGGFVSMAILITAAGSKMESLSSVMDLAVALEPIYGSLARYGLGIGLFAAGITSAITAPMAAAFVARQCFGWDNVNSDPKFRAVWLIIILAGLASYLFQYQPLEIIYIAQIANALLLPVLALFLIWAVQSGNIMGAYKNNFFNNLLAVFVLLLVIGLAGKTFLGLWKQWVS
ncbi:Nramp family divalent metal transporter [Robiginitalea sp.]|jgi:manganese transport protein|nr:Nramp family divalent metal transporter [Robiginitalea sp.]